MNRAPGTPSMAPPEASCSGSTDCPSSTSRTRISRCGGGRRRLRTATCWCSTARSTTTWSCVTSCAPSTALCSPPTATVRRSSPAITTGAPRCCSGCAACSHSRCGTPSPANCSAREIRSASSRCLSPPEPAARRWPVRRNACWTSSSWWGSTPRSTIGRCSTTPSCSTCRNPRHCTVGYVGWNQAASPGSVPTSSRR
ncbi:Uncharacterised protein [Mycobacterium tuberculosis]|uniref:Uncharacterized protein n=2 Tax=Mycobacterium tuberculosis TaxID=1773 RepID=A0A654TRY3_MYCTX|nr:Uncharacterised protein [Mycobacterium tuberculosis]CFE69433.1 Uncharacterised protein [Mycobacterium tuberculosis]CFR81007.1 Uncharacterised protein [Mycobacterium tuberculosis]CFR92036.1 Uncharacterised protein [Mycobacterium tuberculosis]CFS18775.1 Uncharacterised protein [Mycobacterium tuberculosis]